jgi:hypothetical protein
MSMRYKAGDAVWYRGQFSRAEYEGVIRGSSDERYDATEPTYLLTLLSGPYRGQTSIVYERELWPRRPVLALGRGRPAGTGAAHGRFVL